MSQSTTQRLDSLVSSDVWHTVCEQQDLVSNSGVVVWLDGAQVALFYLPDAEGRSLYAIDNHDPQSGANVIGRGLVGSIKGILLLLHRSTNSISASRTAVAWSIHSNVCGSGRYG